MAEKKRYNSYVGYFKKTYGERLQKIVIDGGFTCPNRDGTLGWGGCTYCDNAAFHPAYSSPEKKIWLQIDEGIAFHKVRYRNAEHYLAYFQSFSNTYAPLERLRELYEEALNHPKVVGIVIGTRPDCVDAEKLDYLVALQEGKVLRDWERTLGAQERAKGVQGSAEGAQERETGGRIFRAPIVMVEYGIESCYDKTLQRIHRGHDFARAREAVSQTAARGIRTGAHFILGLPGESREMMLEECSLINDLPLHSIKFHQLQIVKGTAMEKEFARVPQDFVRFTRDEYLDFFVDILERLRPDLYIERIAGEVPPRFVSETPWGLIRNAELLRLLDRRLVERDTFQGAALR